MPTYHDLSKSEQEKQDGYRALIKNSVLKDFVVNNDHVLKSSAMLKTGGNFSGVKVRLMALNSALFIPYTVEEYQKLALDVGLTLIDIDLDYSLSLAHYENDNYLADANVNQAQFVALYRLLQQGLQPKQPLAETQTFYTITANVKEAILNKNRTDAVVVFNALSTFVFQAAAVSAAERIAQAIAYIEDATGKSLTKFSDLLVEVLVPSMRPEATTESVGETFQQKLNRLLQEQAADPRYQESYQDTVELAAAVQTKVRVSPPLDDSLRSQMAQELKAKILGADDRHEVNAFMPVGGPEPTRDAVVKEAAITLAPDPKGYRAWITAENPLLASFIGGQEVSNTEKHKAPGTFATTQNRVAALLTTPYIVYSSTEYRQLLDNLKLTVSASELTTLVASNLTQVRNLTESAKADIVGAYKVIYSALREAGAEGKGATSQFVNNLLTDTHTPVQQYQTITFAVKNAIIEKDQSGKLTAWHLMQDLLQRRLTPEEVADKVFVKANEGIGKRFGFGKKAASSEKEQLVVALTALLQAHASAVRHSPPSLAEIQHGLSSLGQSDTQAHETVQLDAQLGAKKGLK